MCIIYSTWYTVYGALHKVYGVKCMVYSVWLTLENLLIIRKLDLYQELAVKAVRVLTVQIPREMIASNTDPQQPGSAGQSSVTALEANLIFSPTPE